MRALLIGLLVNCAGLFAQPAKNAVPLFFIENRGQAPGAIRFMVKGSGITAYFSPSEVLYRAAGRAVRIEFPGANYSIPEGAGELPGHANFFRGKPEEWVTDVSLFGAVVYRNLYPGIDLRYSAGGRNLKSQFEVSPGSDPSVILMRYADASDLSVSETGELLVPLNGRSLREAAPEVYQNHRGRRIPVEGRFVLAGAGMVRLALGSYDHSLPLIVDPTLSYSTFLGGSSANAATALAVDANGNAYLTGFTSSYNFPTVTPEQNLNNGGNEVFVAKLNPAGSGLVYCTYVGGSGDDRGYGIAVDATGSAYVTGSTTSHNFPTRSPIQSAMLGGKNAFVVKLSPAGNALTFSTYLGGTGSDVGNGIALDPSGNAFVVGATTSLNFPATGFQKTNKGGQDAFVSSISSDGSHLLYSTYLGGGGTDNGTAIAVDSNGGAYVTGSTFSPDFPVANARQPKNAGGQDAFVARLAPGGTALTFSTYLGGSGGGVGNPEAGQGIALDAQGNAYVAGVTGSANFPVLNALQPSLDAGLDAFVAKLSPTGTLLYGTYLGGSGIDVGNAVAVNSSGNAYVAGYTASTDFPIQAGVQTANGGDYDAFVAELSPAGNSLVWSTYLGGSGSDTATAVALDSGGSIYVAGWTLSSDFPLANPYQSVNTDNYAAFVAKVTFPTSVPAVVGITPSSGSGSTQTFSLQFSDVSGAADITSVALLFNTSTAQAGACSVTYVPSQNALALLTDAGTAPAATITAGSGTQQNSQCTLNGAGSSVTMSGTTLTLNIALTFQSAFAGTKTAYLQAANPVGSTGWLSKGSWSVVAGAVTIVSVTPSSGSGSSQAFAFQFSDTAGAADITSVSALFNSSASTLNACSVTYVRAQNTLALLTDAGAAPGTTLTPGSGTQQNSQCTLNGAGSSVSTSGNMLTLTLSLTFQAAFQGAKTVYMQGTNPSGTTSWQAAGTWTVQFGASAVSVTPASGSGSSQTFAFQFSDTGGATDLTSVSVLFNTSASTVSACAVTYARAANTLALLTDAGASPGTTLTPGSGTQQNSQCTLNGAGSSVSTSGNVLTLTLSLTFQSAFQGAKTIYMQAANPSGSTGWQSEGAWTVQFAAASPVSVNPSSGSGSSQTFAFQFSDTGGATDITSVSVLFNTSASTVSACSVTYVRAANTLALLTDAGASPGTTLTPGSGTQQNSQCTLNGAGSSVSTSGNLLTLTLSLTFQPAFQGAKTIYMQATNPSGTTAWQSEGTFTVQFTATAVSVSPASGSGSSQTFAFQFSDTGGATDITSVSVLFNTSASTVSACSVTYVRAANTLALLTDAGASPGTTITPGSGTQQNSQCTLNGAGSSVSTSGNLLTLTLSLTFQPAFQGAKTVYMQATNPSGTTAWQSEGTFTVQFTATAVSVSPASGSGSSQTFAFQFSDTGGATDITSVSVLFNTSASTVSACSVTYVRAQNTLALLTDAGASPGTTITPGSGTQQNSQCILNGAGSSVSTSGNVLTLTLSLTFQAAFQGAKTVYMQATNPSGTTAWQSEGTFTVQFTATAVSVSPASGSGSSQAFAFQFSDTGGATDLTSVSVLFNASASTLSACAVTYVRAQNTLALLTDAGASPGTTITPGSGTQQNSQCTLNGAGSSVSTSGNVLTLTLSLTFQPAFQGAKTVYMQAVNPSGSTGWQSKGAWTVQFGTVSVVSVSPASGSGSSQAFAFQFSDTAGAADITSVSVLFNSSASTVSACSVTYVRAQNTLALLTDAGAAPGTTLTPGSGTQQNSQCTLNGAASSVSTSGNVLTLTLSLTFQPAFQGARTVYMQGTNPAGTTAWQASGSWTVPGASSNPYASSRPIAISHAKVPNTDQTNFPVLISGTYLYLATTANGGQVQNANGYDIVFSSDAAAANLLSFERERYVAATGEVIFWVKVPTLSHTVDTTIYMSYGNASVTTDQATPAQAWDGNFKGVWHLPNGTTLTANDSTGNGNNGTLVNSPAAVAGQIDGAASFNGSGNYVSYPNSSSLSFGTGSFTVSLWMNGNAIQGGGNYPAIIQKSTGDLTWATSSVGWMIWFDNSSSAYKVLTSSGSGIDYVTFTGVSNDGNWKQLAMTITPTQILLYVNGVALAPYNRVGTGALDTSATMNMGWWSTFARYWHGMLDEVHISNVARSADWIATEYNSQSSPSTFFTVGGGAYSPPGYVYSRAIAISHNKVPNSDQTNFPVLISGTYSYLATTANGGHVQNANGYDIVFSSDAAGTNLLSFERERYVAASGEVDFWVKVPTLSHTADTTIYMWYGNSRVIADPAIPAQAWDGNFKGVWHLPNGTTLTANDSTGNGNNGTLVNSPAAVAGQIDGAASFNGSGNYVSYPNSSSLSFGTGSFTVSLWMNGNAIQGGGNYPAIIQKSTGDLTWATSSVGWMIWFDNSSSAYRVLTSSGSGIDYVTFTGASNDGNWKQLAMTITPTQILLYVNGVALAPYNRVGTGALDTSATMNMGWWSTFARYWHGMLDEVHISNVARSADWIATEYNSQNSPSTFYSISN